MQQILETPEVFCIEKLMEINSVLSYQMIMFLAQKKRDLGYTGREDLLTDR